MFSDRPNSQNSAGSRRTSTAQPAYDPLQFVAFKPATSLAVTASKQMELVQNTKKKRESIDKTETEWQDVSIQPRVLTLLMFTIIGFSTKVSNVLIV